MSHVGIDVINEAADNLRDTRTADLPQRIKGRNANMVELFFLNYFLERFNAVRRP
jgi:hypothetical protein